MVPSFSRNQNILFHFSLTTKAWPMAKVRCTAAFIYVTTAQFQTNKIWPKYSDVGRFSSKIFNTKTCTKFTSLKEVSNLKQKQTKTTSNKCIPKSVPRIAKGHEINLSVRPESDQPIKYGTILPCPYLFVLCFKIKEKDRWQGHISER